MKIGILTYFNDLNFGTNIQALATKQVVSECSKNADVEIVNITNFKVRKIPYMSYMTPISLMKDIKRIWSYKKFQKNGLGIDSYKVETNRECFLQFIKGKCYDKIFIGADTCLEMRGFRNAGHLSPYWLDENVESEMIIAAASSRDLEYGDFTDSQKRELDKMVNKYKYIGVRDDATSALFCSIPNIDIDKVKRIPDPTFCLEIVEDASERYFQKQRIKEGEKLIAIRHKKGDVWMTDFIEEAHKRGFKIVSFRPCPKADYVWNDISPLEQTGIYRYFQAVVTHLFHEAVFCFKNRTAVVLYPISKELISKQGESKYTSLLKEFDVCDSCYIEDPNIIDGESLLKKCIGAISIFADCRSSIETILARNEETYRQFIKDSL